MQVLNSSIEKQLASLDEYLGKKIPTYSLIINTGVNSEFLKFLDIRPIYVEHGFEDQDKLGSLNTLFNDLYSINDFKSSISNDFRVSMQKYNIHEERFFVYKKLLNAHYIRLHYRRLPDLSKYIERGERYNMEIEDPFMYEYSQLRKSTLQNKEIFNKELNFVDRERLKSEFLEELLSISIKYISSDDDAIELNDLVNDALAAFQELATIASTQSQGVTQYGREISSTFHPHL